MDKTSELIVCACGCGEYTKGARFKRGHHMRLNPWNKGAQMPYKGRVAWNKGLKMPSVSEKMKGRITSPETLIKKGTRGKNHPAYRGRNCELDFEFEENRILALERDGCKCQICAENNKRKLVVHHIEHKFKNNNVDNLITLCRKCHLVVHRFTLLLENGESGLVQKLIDLSKRGVS